MAGDPNADFPRPAIRHAAERFAGYAPLAAVEVGVWRGDHAASMLEALRPGRLLLVDPWGPDEAYLAWMRRRQGEERTREKLATVDWEAMHRDVAARFAGEPAVRILRRPSVEAAAGLAGQRFHLVYVDGCHSPAAVAADLAAWLPRIVPGGVLAGHDYWARQAGVCEAVDAFSVERGWPFAHAAKDWWFDLPAPKRDLAHERWFDADPRWDDLRARVEWTVGRVGDGPVLDLGCGGGLLGLLLAERRPDIGDVVGVDSDWRAVRDARALLFERAGAHHPCQFLEGPAESLPHADGYFGTVVLGEVLEHVDEVEPVVAEVDRVLAPGGRVVVTVPAGGGTSAQHKRTFDSFGDLTAACPPAWHWHGCRRVGRWFCATAEVRR